MERTVGCQRVELADPVQDAVIPLAFLYPAEQPQRTERFGLYELDVALEAPVVGSNLPLVVLSHGNGGTPWAYRDLAAHLARAGFVVGLPEHPGNSRADNSLAGTVANLENRPRHLCLAIDAAFADPVMGRLLRPDRIGLIGHSIGAYTALAAAGGHPWAGQHESVDGKPHPVRTPSDPCVRALVLPAPATPWFLPEGSLGKVQMPILMRTGGKDEITPEWHADIVKRDATDPALIDHKTVAGAGHFSFMSKFPPAMARPDFPPSQDPEGFDRTALQPSLHADILTFLKRVLH